MSVLRDLATTVAAALAPLGVGPVHARMPYVQDFNQFVQSFTDVTGVRGWIVSARRLRWDASGYLAWTGTCVLAVEGIRAVQSEAGSEHAFLDDIERVIEALRDSLAAPPAVLIVRRVELVRYEAAREIGNVVCHYAEIEIECEVEQT